MCVHVYSFSAPARADVCADGSYVPCLSSRVTFNPPGIVPLPGIGYLPFQTDVIWPHSHSIPSHSPLYRVLPAVTATFSAPPRLLCCFVNVIFVFIMEKPGLHANELPRMDTAVWKFTFVKARSTVKCNEDLQPTSKEDPQLSSKKDPLSGSKENLIQTFSAHRTSFFPYFSAVSFEVFFLTNSPMSAQCFDNV